TPLSTTTTDRLLSGLAHLVFSATPADEVRLIGWVQRGETERQTDTGLHLQSTWAHEQQGGPSWRLFGAYTQSERTVTVPSTFSVDSLLTDPISTIIANGSSTARRWSVGARVTSFRAFVPTFGVDVDGAQMRIPPTEIRRIDEQVEGLHSR